MEKMRIISNALSGKQARKKISIHTFVPYLCILPVLLLFCVFLFYPFGQTALLSLTKTDASGRFMEFVGFDNYEYLFTSADFWKTIAISFEYMLIVVVFSILLGFITAVVSNEKIPGKGVFRVIFSFPMAISAAVACTIFGFMLHPSLGSLNYLLGTNIGWLNTSKWSLFSVSIVTIWTYTGMNFIFITAGLQSVPAELYESANLDGANFFRKHWHITIPSISPTLFFLMIINVINAFQNFAVVRIMTKGGPSGSTKILIYSIYENAFSYGNYARAFAMSVVLFVILSIFTILEFSSEKRVTYE